MALAILVAEVAELDVALAMLARERGDTALFLMHDGVGAASDDRVRAAIVGGLDVTLCAMNAEARGLTAPSEDDAGAARWGSQHDHAVLLRDAARFVALTGGGTAATETRRPRRVLVELGDDDVRAGEGLRAALAYAAVGLDVAVVAAANARPLGPERLPARALSTLRALRAGQDAAGDFDVKICW